MNLLVSILLLATLKWQLTGAYLPVILLHGIFSDAANMQQLVDMITDAHPGTTVYNIDGFDNVESMQDMWTQVKTFKQKLMPIFHNSTDGVHMLCFSQGGLACRAILQTTPEHNVKTFISLSSPQGGQFGDTSYLSFLPNLTKEEMYRFFYSKEGQDLSLANYWKDPHHIQEYLKDCKFLPKLENPSQSSKESFQKLQNIILIGGPDDGVITPWQSSQFASFDDNEKVVSMENQEFYMNDTFGLKTLNSQGNLHVHTVPGVQHVKWHKNETVFKCCMEPYLN